MSSRAVSRKTTNHDGEFLWLVSLSDLMILLFVFFVALFSFSMKKVAPTESKKMAQFDEIQKKILKWVVDKKLLDSVTVAQKEDGVILQIKESALFTPGSFALKSEALDVVEGIGRALALIPPPYRIGVEGHTDDTPVRRGSIMRDNWELSTRRALSVLQALDLDEGLQKRAAVMGFGSSRPLAPNQDDNGLPIERNKSINRRVMVRIY